MLQSSVGSFVPEAGGMGTISPSSSDPWQAWAAANANLQRAGYVRFHPGEQDHPAAYAWSGGDHHPVSAYKQLQQHPDLENISNLTQSASVGDASISSCGEFYQSNPASQHVIQGAGYKRKRSLPGTPDPEAEVIALSPKTLMATNRFICEICNKGFQRDQNLQLHRRGHNLPWKLRQRSTKDLRKRVYVCPEPSCVHHDPSRALGDLTGIKKHFCRKHGEKKWKCDKCGKKYAVQSDWKAHCKTCGTREYRCDCGTLFSRRDSFITHRAFCDALAEESARVKAAAAAAAAQAAESSQAQTQDAVSGITQATTSSQQSFLQQQSGDICEVSVSVSKSKSMQLDNTTSATNNNGIIGESPQWPGTTTSTGLSLWSEPAESQRDHQAVTQHLNMLDSSSPAGYSSLVTQRSCYTELAGLSSQQQQQSSGCSSLSLCTATNTLFNSCSHGTVSSSTSSMSATALLLKASQMGATTSNLSAMRPAGVMDSSTSNVTGNVNVTCSPTSVWTTADHFQNNSSESSPSLEYDRQGAVSDVMINQKSRQLSGMDGFSLRSCEDTLTHDFLGVGAGSLAQREFATLQASFASSGVA